MAIFMWSLKRPKTRRSFPGGQVEHGARALEGERLDGGVALLEGVVPPERDLHLLRRHPPLQGGDLMLQRLLTWSQKVTNNIE